MNPRGFHSAKARIGYFAPHDLPQLSDGYRESYSRFLATVPVAEPVDPAPFLAAARLLYEGPWLAERYAALQHFLATHADAMVPVTRQIIEQGAGPSAHEAFAARYALADLVRATAAVWDQFDALLLPTAPTIYRLAEVEADPLGTNAKLGTYTNFLNLMNLCGVALPAGRTEDDLPFGVTLAAPAGRDYALLDLAARLRGEAVVAPQARAGETLLAVCGAHLSGQPLNPDLLKRGAYLASATSTAAHYRLFALPDGKRPALVRDPAQGSAIEIEVWAMPTVAIGGFLETIAPPLGLGSVELSDGSWVHSFIAEPIAMENAREITHFGGWRAYRAAPAS